MKRNKWKKAEDIKLVDMAWREFVEMLETFNFSFSKQLKGDHEEYQRIITKETVHKDGTVEVVIVKIDKFTVKHSKTVPFGIVTQFRRKLKNDTFDSINGRGY
jgi:hypothetical protein